jgi:hypothetical protein
MYRRQRKKQGYPDNGEVCESVERITICRIKLDYKEIKESVFTDHSLVLAPAALKFVIPFNLF